MEFRPDRNDLGRYLEDTELIDWQTPAVIERARALTETAGRTEEALRTVFEWVRDEISHSVDAGSEIVTCRASQVLREGTGLCFAKSHLLVALLRSRGIPAGFCYQRLRRDAPAQGHVLHGFAAVYLHAEERFAALDPRGDREGIATHCDLRRPSLAHTPDPEAGEETYGVVYARPHPGVVDVLTRAPDLKRALAGLPDRP